MIPTRTSPGRTTGFLTAAMTVLALIPTAAFGAPPGPTFDPERIASLNSGAQAVIVAVPAVQATRASVLRYERRRGHLALVGKAEPARIGRNGLSDPRTRTEGDGTTPSGLYALAHGFGSQPNPGMKGFRWRRLTPLSCWSAAPSSYNRWIETHDCASMGENLWSYRATAYRYAAVIDFNYLEPTLGRGSGIFFHVMLNRPTAGCISLREPALLDLLRWVSPGAKVLIATEARLRQLSRS